jgi:Tfp pilus assembly protein PilV
MFKILDRIEAALSSKKGKIICGVVAMAVIGFIVFQNVQATKAAEKVEATQLARREAAATKLRDAKAAEAAAKAKDAAADKQYTIDHPVTMVYEEIHEMANGIVIADDIWAEKPITKAGIARLIKTVKGSTYENKSLLYSILSRWKNGNFSQADKDHNYVWFELGGNVGKATDVDTSKLPSWAN